VFFFFFFKMTRYTIYLKKFKNHVGCVLHMGVVED